MNKLQTVFGLIILLAGALVVYYLLKAKPTQTSEEPAGQVATEVSVHVGKISRATLYGHIQVYGRVKPAVGDSDNPPAHVLITAPTAGIISEVKCTEGQLVSQGDLLLSFDSRLAEASVKEAQQVLKFEEQNLKRQEELFKVQGTSEKLLLEIQHQVELAQDEFAKANTELSLLQVTAPISGQIVRILVGPGESVDMSATLAELIDIGRLIIEFQVPSEQMALLKTGQKVEIETSDNVAEPNNATSRVPAELTFIDSVVDPQSSTVLARAPVPARTGFRPGQFVKVRVIYVEKTDCLVVPEESLVTTPDGRTVIAVVENDKAFQKVVQAGLRENGLVEVQAEGIHEGMQIVTVGAYGLPAETRVRIVNE